MAEHSKKNQNILVLTFIPNKKDSTTVKIRKIIVIICLFIFIGCGIYILTYFESTKADKKMNDELLDIKNQAEEIGGTLNLLKEEINEKTEEQHSRRGPGSRRERSDGSQSRTQRERC